MNSRLLAVLSVILFASFVEAYPAPEDTEAVQELNNEIDAAFASVEPDNLDDDAVATHGVFSSLKKGIKKELLRYLPTLVSKGEDLITRHVLPKTIKKIKEELKKEYGEIENEEEDNGDVATHGFLSSVSSGLKSIYKYFKNHPEVSEDIVKITKQVVPDVVKAVKNRRGRQ